MANYYNPYMQTSYPVGYQMPMQQSYAAQNPPMQSNVIPVDGEVGAKAFTAPAGSTGPIALWDTNDNVIYLRTFNAAGMPNPLKKLRYTEEEPVQNLPGGQSGSMQSDMSMYATKDDFENLKQEIRHMIQNNQNGSRNNGQGRQG